MFCTECGTNNPDTNHFCKNCGKPLRHAHPVQPPAAPVPGPATAPPQPFPVTGTVTGPAGATPTRAKDFGEFKASLMTVDEFKKMSKDVPLKKRPQRWWDLLCIMGGIAAAVIWFFYGGLREGFDWMSSLLMIAIPVILVWFRPVIDQILLPLQPARKKIPRILLLGLGIAIPFLTAWILYNYFHITQYSLMQANIVIGTFAAYAITRTPRTADTRRQEPGRGAVQAVAITAFAILIVSVLIVPVPADDCTRDPLNARDCLRTSGFAEGMAGLIAAILSGLVNGPIIIQGLLQGEGGEETEEGETEEEEGGVSIRLTYPAGYSPRVFTKGWFFGASARIGDKDVSDTVRWGGTGKFSPDTGRFSRPVFGSVGPNMITLTVTTGKGDIVKTFPVNTVNPAGYACVGDRAKCDADVHGCPACPHPTVGPIISGSPTIMVPAFGEYVPAARVGDTGVHAACCGPNTFTIISGDPTVLIDGRPAARCGDTTRHCGGVGRIVDRHYERDEDNCQ